MTCTLSGAGAIAIHESAHILTARILGVKVKRIGANWRGPYLVRDAGTPIQNLLITLAGPLSNLATAWLCLQAKSGMYLWLMSVTLGIFNLLPIPGSDGMRALKTAINIWKTSQVRERNHRLGLRVVRPAEAREQHDYNRAA